MSAIAAETVSSRPQAALLRRRSGEICCSVREQKQISWLRITADAAMLGRDDRLVMTAALMRQFFIVFG